MQQSAGQIPNAKQASDATPHILDSVPSTLPALAQCQRISELAAGVGFEWESEADVWDQVASERAEMEAEAVGTRERAEEFGDLLFSLVNVARFEGIDAEKALASSNAKFRRRWARVEELARESGAAPEECDADELNEFWRQTKREERGRL